MINGTELQKTQIEYNKIYSFAVNYVSKKMHPFTADDLKLAYFQVFGEIEHYNLLGNVMNQLKERGLIKFNNVFVRSKIKVAKGHLLKQWISKRYSDAQSKKRILPDTEKERELLLTQTTIEL